LRLKQIELNQFIATRERKHILDIGAGTGDFVTMVTI
jgi:ubiquinone/menaquinone biosynthesis C-methylase UbiE